MSLTHVYRHTLITKNPFPIVALVLDRGTQSWWRLVAVYVVVITLFFMPFSTCGCVADYIG